MRMIKFFSSLLCLVLLLPLVLTGCQGDSAQRVIKIGAIFPLDGQWSGIGLHAEVALNQALETLNEYLKPDNMKVELQIENSSGDPQKALDALKKLAKDGFKSIIGPCTSEEAVAIVSYANENDIFLFSPSSTAASLALDDNLFRMAPNDNNQAEALAQLISRQDITRVLMVCIDDEYGRGIEAAMKLKAANPDYGFQVVDSVFFMSNLDNYDSLVQSITAAAAGLNTSSDAVVLIGSDANAIGIFSSAGLQSPLADIKWFSGDGIIRQPSILENSIAAEFAAKVDLEGFAFACEETLTFVPMMMTAGLMSAELGTAPSPDALPVWDALWYIAETYRRNPDAGITAFKSDLKTISASGANVFSQIVAFDDNGDILATKYARFSAQKNENGKIHWNLDGMFIRNVTSGAFITDADANFTQASGDIVIGAILPLTGANAETGKGAKAAIDLALEHAKNYYTKTEGLDIRFTVDARDSASDPATALSQIKALHAEGIDLIIWPGSSNELSAVQDYARENNIIIIGTRSSAVSLADADDLIYRMTPDDTHQAKALTRLIEAQGKKNLVVLYRDDVYGQDFQNALSETYQGSLESYNYAVTETDFSSVLDKASDAVEKTGSYSDTAVLAIGLDEVIPLLEAVEDGPLTSVSWYGTDGIAQSQGLLASSKALAVAKKTKLTCSAVDIAAARTFVPTYEVAFQYLTQAAGHTATWNEIAAYDAAWLAMNAYAMTSPQAGYQELWSIIDNKYGAAGLGCHYVVNSAQDQTLSFYSFFTVTETSAGAAWTASAYYRDILYARDNLYIIEK